ncbi:MAG: 3-ketoacyl-ACP reductase [Ardenticatenaceae bacterium]|nr:MAG: 3-ketoacyl-ACP reductase [Ardenticatenaceae bacterium]
METVKRTAFISGSGRNIGRACAKELAEAGFNVVINGSSDKDACKRVADEVRAMGVEAVIAMGDVGRKSDIDNIVNTALDAFGCIDVLINNAAIRPGTEFLSMTDEDLETVMNVNCYASVWLARAFLPGMVKNGWGRIINFTGMNAQQGTGGRPHVTMSKHAAWGLAKALSHEFGAKGITANTISPGTFPDEDEDISQSERFQKLLKQNPAGRLGLADDIAAAVGLLCSDRGGFINGQLLQINGGVVN